MNPETIEALRSAADDEFIEAFSDAMRTQDDLAAFVDEMHRRADANREAIAARDAQRRAALALAEMQSPSTAKN